MKVFQMMQLEEAVAYAASGGQALHLHRICGPKAPTCFKMAIRKGENIAHLFDMDVARLLGTAYRLGINHLLVEKRGTSHQHIDLCGGPLRKAMALAETEDDHTKT